MSESFEQDPLAKKIHDLFLMKTKKKSKTILWYFIGMSYWENLDLYNTFFSYP